jgi:uncharacterized protein YjbI with pentapeptide repeats
MANPQQLELLLQGSETWNQWRRDNLGLRPDLHGADLIEANLFEANLLGADLSRAHIRGANLSGAHLIEANLIGADLSRANLSGAHLSRAHLSEANLFGANLRQANLRQANLSRANLSGAHLSRAHLRGADLGDADLSSAHLFGADLSGAHLRGADLSRAHLGAANFSLVYDFNGANLSAAKIGSTNFGDTNLTDVQGLDACDHLGPSILDYQTLANSWPLPLVFLRGCGLPEQLIEYLPSLLTRAIQFYSCFISYSTEDQAFAERLYADLQNKGVRCWFAPHDIQRGKKIHEQIDEAIRLHDRLLLILSEASIHSEWVKTEISKARKREIREKRRMLFPVRLVDFETLRQWECFDADMGKDSAQEIREYYVPDFSKWKNHDTYQREFERLIRDLKPDEKSTTSV